MAAANSVASDFLDFLNASPTAFHAVDEAKKRLEKEGYEQVSERDDWSLEVGKKYFFTRNHSTIIAFAIGKRFVAGNGFHIVGAHTDSPCLKVKPNSKMTKGGYVEVAVQTYGGGLWHTWFDRDLTIAGRVIVKSENDGFIKYSNKLVRMREPIMRIPTLAIHLDRNVAEGFKFNNQAHLLPVLATSVKAELQKQTEKNDCRNEKNHHPILMQLISDQVNSKPTEICDFELQICDTQPSVLGGSQKEFIFSGRLDNLCMSFCSLKALIDSTSSENCLDSEPGVRMVALFDNEEVGSNSAQGAGSPVLLDALTGNCRFAGRKLMMFLNFKRTYNFHQEFSYHSTTTLFTLHHSLKIYTSKDAPFISMPDELNNIELKPRKVQTAVDVRTDEFMMATNVLEVQSKDGPENENASVQSFSHSSSKWCK